MSDFKPVSTFNYNNEQLLALEKLLNWSNSLKPNVFTLEGSAGTGKTTIMKEFIKTCNYRSGIAVTAPTHKAVRVISTLTGQKGVTIQKLLGLRPNYLMENFNVNNIGFARLGRPTIGAYKLIIIDEASMINASLHKHIVNEANQFNVKVLFVGDSCQLPPINENISNVFKTTDKVTLKQIMRQEEDNPLTDLLEVARDDVINNTFNVMKLITRNPNKVKDGKGYMSVNDKMFKFMIERGFNHKDYEKDIDAFKLAAYKNDTVLHWNKFIRSKIFKGHDNNFLIMDDLLTSYNTILDEFNSPIIVNSEDYILNDMQYYINESGIKGYIVRLTKVFGGESTPYMFIVNIADEDNKMRFLSIANNLVLAAKNATRNMKRARWEAFYKFKNSNLLTSTIFDDQGKPILTKDLDYGYGLTIHKTQGSTYNNVFVNLNDIIYNKRGKVMNDPLLRSKLIYVAISRASKSCIILNK